jgi:hypothetical protein
MRKSIALLFVLVLASFILFGCTGLKTNCPGGEIPIGGVCSTTSELIDAGEELVDFVMPTQEEIQSIQNDAPVIIHDETTTEEEEIEDLMDELTPEGMIETQGTDKISKLSFVGTTPQIPFSKNINAQLAMTTTIDLESLVNVTNFSGTWSDYKGGCKATIETSSDGTNWDLIENNIGIATGVAIPHAEKINGEMQYIRFTKQACTTNADILTANITGYLIHNPLVAHYAFEGTTNDASGNGRDGVNKGMTFTQGISGEAGSFEEGDNIKVENFGVDLSNEYTISAWINSNDLGKTSFPLELLYGKPLLLIKEQKPVSVMWSATDTKWKAYASNELYLANNQWNHIAMSYTSDGVITTYVNGKDEIIGIQDEHIGNYPSNPTFQIGGRNNAWYNGLIDEVKIFDRALSKNQIESIYNENKPINTTEPTQTHTVTNGLIAHYTFENNSTDSSGTQTHAINKNVEFVNDGIKGKAGQFSNAAQMYALDLVSQLKEEVTITGWVKADSYQNSSFPLEIGWGKPVIKFNKYGISGIFRNQEDTTWNSYYAPGSQLPANEWNFVALTYGTDDTVTIYLNETKFDVGAHPGFIGGAPEEPVFIMGGRNGMWFNGLIDEVRVYDRGLNENEINTIYFKDKGVDEIDNANLAVCPEQCFFSKISDALEYASKGATITVESGNYNSFTVDKEVNLIGRDNPTINGGIIVEADNVTIDGFVIDQGIERIACYPNKPAQMGAYLKGKNIVFTNNIVQNLVASDVLAEPGIAAMGLCIINSDNIQVTSNSFKNFTAGDSGETMPPVKINSIGGMATGVMIFSSTNTNITENTFENFTAGAGGICNPVGTVTYCAGGISTGTYLYDSANNNISNNVFSNFTAGLAKIGTLKGSGGTATGLYLDNESNNNIITDNTFENFSSPTIDDTKSYTGNVYGIFSRLVSDNEFKDNSFTNFIAQGRLDSDLIKANSKAQGIYIAHTTDSSFINNIFTGFEGGIDSEGRENIIAVQGRDALIYRQKTANNHIDISFNDTPIEFYYDAAGGIVAVPGKQLGLNADYETALIANYSFEGNVDDSTNNSDGTINGTPEFVDGKVGQAFSFNGDDSVTISNLPNFTGTNQTVSFWVKTTGQNNQWIINLRPIALVKTYKPPGQSHAIRVNARINSPGIFNKYEIYPTTPNVWKHVVITVQSRTANIYENGVYTGQIELHPSNVVSDNSTQPTIFTIGEKFNGLIDEVSVFDRALNHEEVFALYNHQVA